jgi:hypothetical protein
MNVRKVPTPKINCGTICFEAKCTLHRMSMGDKSNIIDEAKTFSFHRLIRRVERNLLRRTLSIQP